MNNVLSPQEVLNFFAVYLNGKKVWDFSQWLYNIHTQMTIILEFTSTYNETSALWMYPKTDEKVAKWKVSSRKTEWMLNLLLHQAAMPSSVKCR